MQKSALHHCFCRDSAKDLLQTRVFPVHFAKGNMTHVTIAAMINCGVINRTQRPQYEGSLYEPLICHFSYIRYSQAIQI